MSDSNSDFAKKFEALRQSYVGRLGEKLSEIEAHRDTLIGTPENSAAAIDQIMQCAHKLAGNAATFGFAELGEAAADLEQVCEKALQAGAGDSSAHNEIAAKVGSLRNFVNV